MNRELTKRETAMLLFLVILVIALGYFKLIFEPIQDQTARYQSDAAEEQGALELQVVRLRRGADDPRVRQQRKADAGSPPDLGYGDGLLSGLFPEHDPE